MGQLTPLNRFVVGMTHLMDQQPDEATVLIEGKALLQELIKDDAWLPDDFAKTHPQYYQQYLLHADPLERFSVVSFVWGPGQKTPIHNHTVWGLVGILRGAEKCQLYKPDANAKMIPHGSELTLHPGDVEAVSPTIGDVHVVRNAFDDQPSISIHVYGGNIGKIKRSVFDEQTGQEKVFVSGYANDRIPNIWSQDI
jgi:predicted metal-dependent enzyme (double-stranded beta helix superfamily)